MGDIKLFRTTDGTAQELGGTAAGLEKPLQSLMERNLKPLLGVRSLQRFPRYSRSRGGQSKVAQEGAP